MEGGRERPARLERRRSVYGVEERIVLDLGSRVARIGFSGDATPRVMLDIAPLVADALGRDADVLYDLDEMRVASADARRQRRMELHMALARVLRVLYQDYMLCDPKLHRVLVAHPPWGLDALQHALCDVLLRQLRAPSVSFVPTHVLCALAAARTTALVVDVGYLETCAMPVYDGRPMLHLAVTTPRGGRFLARALARLLEHVASGPGAAHLARADVERVLTEGLVAAPARPPERRAVTTPLDPAAFADAYADTPTTARDWSLRTAHGALHVPGWLRERACEVLFEPGDEDEKSVVECLVACAAALPRDTRRAVLGSVLIAGGTAMLPHFRERCVAQARDEMGPTDLVPDTLRLVDGMHGYVPSNLLAWIGGSLAGHAHADGIDSVSREAWDASVARGPEASGARRGSASV